MSHPERRRDLALHLGATKTVKPVTDKWGNVQLAFITIDKKTFLVSKAAYFKLVLDKDLIAAEFARLQDHKDDPTYQPRWDNRLLHEIDQGTGGSGKRWIIRWVRIKPEWIRGRPPPKEIWTLDMRRWFKTPIRTPDWQMDSTTGFYFTQEEWQEFYYEIKHISKLLRRPPLSAADQISIGNKQVEEEYNNSVRKRFATPSSGSDVPPKKRGVGVAARSAAFGPAIGAKHLQQQQDPGVSGGNEKKKAPRIIKVVSPAKAAKIKNLLGFREPAAPKKQEPETVVVPTRLMDVSAEDTEEEKCKATTAGEKKEQQQPKQHPKAAAATVEKGKRRGTTPKQQQPPVIPRRGPAKKPASAGRRGQPAKTMASQQQQEQVAQRNTDGEDQ